MENSPNKTKKYSVGLNDNKGHKLVSAIHLVTNHMPEHAPLKLHIRELIILIIRERDFDTRQHLASSLQSLLEAAAFTKQISDKNSSIIIYEIGRFVAPLELHKDAVAALFETESPVQKMSFTSAYLEPKRQDKKTDTATQQIAPIVDTKDKRKQEILSFINSRSATTVKDIQRVHPVLSEKTIQRDLLSLVESDQIVKQGSKRWSLYLPK